uniref:Uncharacterized protein n=1 Tax=Arundo donax TaxID=35708 RepID=A0A0A9FYM4_ARUDO
MVQEFTGIPSPPFAAGVVGGPATSLRTRFDHIFPSPSSFRSAAADTASLPQYLLRPFAQKLPTAPSTFPPFTSSSSSTPSSSNIGVANANATTGTPTAAAASSNPTAQGAAAAAPGGSSDTFQLTSSALLRLQDPSSYLSFQNLLDSQPSSQSMFGAADGFTQAPPRLHDPSPSPSEFLAGVGSGGLGLTHGALMGSEGLHLHPRSDAHHHSHGGDELSGVVAGGGSCKLNYSHAGVATSSSAAAGANKPPDGGAGAPARPGRGGG